MPQTITCTITNSAGAVIPELNVRAYALQPGRETLLAQGLSNDKGVCRLEYEWAGSKVLHVQVRAFSFAGAQLGASEVVYNAKTQEQIRFSVKPPAPPKEYEGIQAVLRHILPEGQTLAANEGALVVKSLAAYAGEIPKVFRQQVNASRLDYVVHCETLAAESGLPAAFLYGICRTSQKKQTLDYFLETEDASLWASLDRAEQQNYVEPLDRAELRLQLETLRGAKNPVTQQHLWGQLLNAADDTPLPGLLVRAFGPGSGDTLAGEDRSDRGGRFFIRVRVPKTDAAFRLDVFRGEDEQIHSAPVRLQDDAHLLRLQVPALPDLSPTLRQTAEETSWTQLQPHLQALEAAGLRSLDDVRKKGVAQASLPAEIAQRLEAQAHLDVLPAARPAFAHDLITQGFVSPLAVARASKGEFIAKMRNKYGDFTPANLHEQALALEASLGNFFAQELLEPGKFTQGGNGGVPEPPEAPAEVPAEADDPLDLVPQACGCEHCSNAVSPAAYFTELMVYALRHIKKGNAALTLADLQAAFHQPFGDLPATCGDANRTMRQIRLSLEVLRAYLAARGLPAADTPEASQFDMACRKFREHVYFQLLEDLSTSYDEIRNVTPAEKANLTQRLGIPLQHDGQDTLTALFQPPEALQEAALEQLFGWRDTTRSPLTEPEATPLFLQWQKAFRRQNWWQIDWPETLAPEARPWIDPDLIALDYLVDPLTGAASDLWHGRREALRNQFENYRQTRESAANDQAAWEALFPEPEVLEQIRQANPEAGKYADNVYRHIQETSPITGTEWENLYHILVQHFKNTHYAEWRQQEKDAGIFLSPDFFRIPPPVFNFDLVQEEDQTQWRTKRADFRDWRDRLKGRIEQDRTDAAALADAVAKAEEAHLPALRQILIQASDAMGADLHDKASWLAERLLIATTSDAGIMTTRMQQAIESVQLLIWGLRTGQLEDTHPDWSLAAESFDEEWKWLGHYASWRSAMLVFLYPENLLQPTLRRRQTPVFRAMVNNTRNSAQFTPKEACALAETYGQYSRDVNNLRPEASVIARTHTVAGECGAKTGKGERNFVYLFAQSEISKKVYMARYEEGDWYEQSHWEEVPGLNQVLNVAGACVYAVTPDERYIYLFVKVQDGRNEALVYTRYDLQKDAWTVGINQLDPPPSNPNVTTTFDVVVKKTFREDEPPHLAFRNRGGELYGRRMNIDGSDWQEADFEMLEVNAYLSAMQTARLCEMIESKRGEYYLIRETSAAVEYRLFGKMDDGQWRRVVGPKHCLGALPWQKNGGAYVFLGDPENGSNPSYVLIRRPEQEPVRSILISTFRKQESELGLEDYLLTRMSGSYLNKEIFIHYYNQWYGLLDFLYMKFGDAPNKDEYEQRYGYNANSEWTDDYKKSVKKQLKRFSLDTVESEFGYKWLFISRQMQSLSGFDLKSALERLFENERFDIGIEDDNHVIKFKRRLNTEQEVSEPLAILPGLRKIVAACGEMPVNPYARVFYSIKPYGLTPPNWENAEMVNYAFAYDVSTNWPGTNTKTSLYRSTLFNPKNIQLQNVSPELAAPHVNSGYDIRSNYSEVELTKRIGFIRRVFQSHEDARPWIKTYQEEAFYFLPVYLALQLQRNGFYQEAADWLRSVYDFNRPLNGRKIYYGLIKEETLGAGLERVADWLGDPLNPHAIAETRANAYTRFTLLSIIRLLLDHANSEFTRYTADTLPRARTLYQTALHLLQAPELTADPAFCEKALEELDQIADKNLHPNYSGVWKQVQAQFGKIGKASTLKSAVDWAKGVLANQASERERLRILAEGAHNQFGDLPATTKTADKIEHQHKTIEKVRTALFRHPEASRTLRQLATVASRDYTRKVSLLSGISETALNAGPVEIPWLGNKLAGEEKHAELKLSHSLHPAETPVPVFGFCIPDNPVIEAWALEAEVNLHKLQSGRDIAGLERQALIIDETIDINSLPSIGSRGDITLPGKTKLPPTPYRYAVLIERARQLANMAQQMESYFLSALEKRDAEMYQRLKAGQEVELTRAGVRLNQLKVREAEDGIVLAELQRDRAVIQEEHFQELLNNDLLAAEQDQLEFLKRIADYQLLASIGAFIAASTPSLTSIFSSGKENFRDYAAGLDFLAQSFGTKAQIFSIQASYERRKQDWTLTRNLARQDVRIGNQQIRLSKDRLRIVNQEHHISELQVDHAQETLDFLINKFTNVDLYDWMSGVLEGVYASFLQQATAVAQLAEQQLNFERQVEQRFIIQSDYWTSPRTLEATVLEESVDRRGLTGSARLLQDIAQLDQYAFSADRRKHELTKTISLAQVSPVEFQQFRDSGILPFDTLMDWFDRDFPGHYLRLIKRVRVSVIALVPPLDGIKAALYCQGYSKVIRGEPRFAEATLPRPSETVALTSPINATGRFEFELQQQSEMRNPFEGTGVAASWEFQMPKAANNIDYDTIADVLLTIEYTALHSNDYRRMVIQQLDRTFSADRPFSFRNQFADQWYDLNNPEETASRMEVKFKTDRKDFPPNVDHLKIQQVVLYFSRADGETEEINIDASLFFIEQGKTDEEKVGGAATTQDDIISTRRSNGNNWTTMQGKSPIGEWVLSFDEELSSRFKNNKIEDILFVITFQGETPEWPKLPA